MNIWPVSTSSSRAHDVFKKSSKTYYYSSRFFSQNTQRAVTRLYAFVRIADNYVDNTPQDQAGFMQFRREYEKKSKPRKIIQSFHDLETEYDLNPAWTHAFLDSMQQDLTKQHYTTLDETREYMYGSAEVIGLMLAAIFNVPQSAHEAARSLGRGMQYINFLRDIHEDREMGRTYIPRDIRKEYGMRSLSKQYAQDHSESFKRMMRSEIKRGLQWLTTGRRKLSSLPNRARISTATATDMYAWTARQIRTNPFIIYDQKIKPSVYRILFTGIKRSIYDRSPTEIQKTNSAA